MSTKIFFVAVLSIALTLESIAQDQDRVRINGYSSFEYENRISGEDGSDPNGSFDADLIDLVINVDVTSNLRFSTDLTWEHGAATEDGLGNVAVEYAFPEYTVRDWLKFRVGKMFVPFGIYNEIHTAKPAFLAVKEPLSTNKPHKFGADTRFYPRWATGISILGNFSVKMMEFEYNLQISNGNQDIEMSGINMFEEDDNKQKAIAFRLLFSPIQDLKLGVSTYSDIATVYSYDSNEDEYLATDSTNRVFSISGHAEYSHNNFGAEFEFISGEEKVTNTNPMKKQAFEAMVYYTFIDRITPYVRYEFLDPNLDVSSDEAKMFSFGINTRIDKSFFLKLQYNSINSGVDNGEFSGMDLSEFQAAIVLGF
ncbi:MAG: hypothetical protein JXR07_04780 [Reichenbachiella sp.]